ncbi:uncharacterized protein LOC131697650 [Acipenser ruthenus]|uniref:uncharacterized protein LOC131697650 n=1 Tax=Acipenser ruthenus TaxID=7906 RepID=UPI0027423473|nr:uncharacterized protein LOC131697650 [Acipenser ruthenus]
MPHNWKCRGGSESDTFNGSIDFRCPFADHGDHRRLSSERQKLKIKERMMKTTPVIVEGESHTNLPISLSEDRSMKPCISIRRKKNQPQIKVPLQSVNNPSSSITLHTTELNSEGKKKSNSQQDNTIQDEQKSKGVHELGRTDAGVVENDTSLTDEGEFSKGLKVDTVSQCSITDDEQPNWIHTQYVESTAIAETGDGIQEKFDSASMHIFDNWESLTLSGSLIEIETQAGRQFDFESGADGCFTINSSEVAELSIGDK